MIKIDPTTITKRKEELEQEKERLENQIAKLRNYPDIDYGYAEDDQALEVELFGNNMGLVDSLDKSLRKVKDALGRIEEGKFGVCDACGGFIEPARMESLPETEYCAACAAEKK